MEREKGCSLKDERPVMALLDLLGRRWALRILWELKEGALTFRSLQERCGGISPTVMSKRIAEMRDAKILEQVRGAGYSITRDGLKPCSTLLHLNSWANDMDDGLSLKAEPVGSTIRFCPLCGTPLTTKAIEDKERLVCPLGNCNYVFWDNPTPVVAVIVEHEGAVLLARNKNWPEKIYGLITGFLETNETVEEAVVREVEEELGLSVTSVDFICNQSFTEMNQLLVGFHVKTTGEVVIGEELSEVKPVEIKKLKAWPFGTGFIVQKWLDNINSKQGIY